MTPLVWDLDGTLVETRQANYLAYISLGVKPPEDFNTRPWQEWCSPEAHEAKGKVIHGFILNYAKPLQLLKVWEVNGKGVILTNASLEAVTALRERFSVLEDAMIHHGRDRTAKTIYLQSQPRHGIYFDDSEKTIDFVNRNTKWHTVLVQ